MINNSLPLTNDTQSNEGDTSLNLINNNSMTTSQTTNSNSSSSNSNVQVAVVPNPNGGLQTSILVGYEVEINSLTWDGALRALRNSTRPSLANAVGFDAYITPFNADAWTCSTDPTVRSEQKTNPMTCLETLAEGMQLMEDAGADVNGTNTGLHMNVDMRNESLQTLKNISIIWLQAEALAYKLVARSRSRRGGYSAQQFQNMSSLSRRRYIANVRQASNVREWQRATGRGKYRSMNVNNVSSNSPRIEWRLHQGSLNGIKAGRFAQMLCSIVEAARRGVGVCQHDGYQFETVTELFMHLCGYNGASTERNPIAPSACRVADKDTQKGRIWRWADNKVASRILSQRLPDGSMRDMEDDIQMERLDLIEEDWNNPAMATEAHEYLGITRRQCLVQLNYWKQARSGARSGYGLHPTSWIGRAGENFLMEFPTELVNFLEARPAQLGHEYTPADAVEASAQRLDVVERYGNEPTETPNPNATETDLGTGAEFMPEMM